ncbi:MAG: DUF814 domain-containing protein [Candidatus Eremiobacteraeota bacterium]|nr:DUF814 domain-containing protein [Candidatus Eremiobacteraeota bacterium]
MIFVGVGCVFTDWILIARLARELHTKIARARVTALGHLDDRRIALEYWREGKSGLVAFDLFGRLPIATLEGGELAISSERGFIRAAGAVLRGLTLTRIDALPHERVLRFEFATRSRFGVAASSVLIAELIPRFGNLILLKDETIVAAYKEFNLRSGSRRAIRPGVRYEPPPAIAQPSKLPASLCSAFENNAGASEIARALREVRPRLPQLLAASVVAEIRQTFDAHTLAPENVLGRADALLTNAEDAIEAGELFAYYDRGVLVQAHVVPLQQFTDFECSAQPELLPILYQARMVSFEATGGTESTKERRDLSKKLQHQLSKTSAEIDAVEEQLEKVAERDLLRAQGDQILATLHERSETEREEAKVTAASLFARYKRLSGSATPLQKRREALVQKASDLQALSWELERSSDADLSDVLQAAQTLLLGTRARAKPTTLKRKRARVVVEAPGGSRIFVGRSPVENADLTFTVARPNDLWFHARGTPGAHVILQRDDRAEPPLADLELAASLAAFFSRAKESPRVDVDYTLRKFVRKRPAAAPGLVFYTEAKTMSVTPQDLPKGDELQK